MTPDPDHLPRDEADAWWCGACGYPLPAEVRCPECGREAAITRRRPGEGPRWRTRLAIAGRPLVAVAWGRRGRERFGSAEGVIACGDRARGIIAVGTVATGPVAIGLLARGVVAFGGLAVGFIGGGLAGVGVLAVGWFAAGYAAKGSAAVGCYAGGGAVAARFARIGDGALPEDLPAFAARLTWLFESWPASVMVPLVAASAIVPLLVLGTSLLLQVAARRTPPDSATGPHRAD
ncbi:MAG: hypothetical protein ACYTEV_04275 [Planctomycetota bacterium]|jgi:hypothetical protein